MSTPFDSQQDEHLRPAHPLDSVEDVLNGHNWTFRRVNPDELVVQVTGKMGDYRIFFIWQDSLQALQFCAQFDLHVKPYNIQAAHSALLTLNEHLWMGHFDLPKDTAMPTYRYTVLFRGLNHSTATETIEDIVDISMAQCERYFPVFSFLSGADLVNDQHLSLALMETAGES